MRIVNVSVQNEGYVFCNSNFYSAQDTLSNSTCYNFSIGINKLQGEIDSGNWAISYLLSMYKHRPKDFVLFDSTTVMVNNDKTISIDELSLYSCYLDKLDPLFTYSVPVNKLVLKGLKRSHSKYSCDDIKSLFQIDNERFERPLSGVGNEIFKAMAAIAFANGKEIYCFPWLSNKRFSLYDKNLTELLETLKECGKIVIMPVGVYGK